MNATGVEQFEEEQGPQVTIFTYIRKFLALVCVIFFAVTAALTLVVMNVEPIFLRPLSYQRAFASEGVYAKLPDAMAEQLSKNCLIAEIPIDNCLNRDDWEVLLTFLAPTEELQDRTESALTQFSLCLNSSTAGDRVLVSLKDFKNRLKSPEFISIVQEIMASKPECTAEEMRSGNRDRSNMPVCRPPDEYRDAYWREFRQEIKNAADKIPDEIDLMRIGTEEGWENHLDEPPQTNDVLEQEIRPTVRMVRLGFWLTPLLACPWLLLILAFGVRSKAEWFRWWGSAFLLAGVFGVILGVILVPILGWSFSAFSQDVLLKEWGTGLTNIAQDVFGSLTNDFAIWMGTEALVLGGLGLTMLVASRWQA